MSHEAAIAAANSIAANSVKAKVLDTFLGFTRDENGELTQFGVELVGAMRNAGFSDKLILGFLSVAP